MRNYFLRQPGDVLDCGLTIESLAGYFNEEPYYKALCNGCNTSGVIVTQGQIRRNTAKCTSSTHFVGTKETRPVSIVMAKESEPTIETEAERVERERLSDVIRAAARIGVSLSGRN